MNSLRSYSQSFSRTLAVEAIVGTVGEVANIGAGIKRMFWGEGGPIKTQEDNLRFVFMVEEIIKHGSSGAAGSPAYIFSAALVLSIYLKYIEKGQRDKLISEFKGRFGLITDEVRMLQFFK